VDHKEGIKKPVPAILKQSENRTITYNQQIAELAATSEMANNPLQDRLIEESKKDKLLQGILEDAEAGQSSGSKSALEANKDGIAYLHSLIYVPQAMRKEIIRMHYDLLMSGH
jgi:hypothetical protein